MLPPDVCQNNCCRSQPCLNGGTCTEYCESPKTKFTCKCPSPFYGNICEIRLFDSCVDVLRFYENIPPDRVYTITRPDNNNTIPLYCSFVSPNQAWTLIESFALSNNGDFKNKPFNNDFGSNKNEPPHWGSFRLTKDRMAYVKSKSTLFRATCDFPNRNGVLTPDLLIGNLSDVDIMSKDNIQGCQKYNLVNFGGEQCTDCTARSFSGSTAHFHLDVSDGSCDFKPPVKSSLDSFGLYNTCDDKSKCTATPQSTTQWWLGAEK